MDFLIDSPFVLPLLMIVLVAVWPITFLVTYHLKQNQLKNQADTLRQNIKKIGNPVAKSYSAIRSILGEPDVNETVMEENGTPGTIKRWGRFSDFQFCLAFDEKDICTRVDKCNISL